MIAAVDHSQKAVWGYGATKQEAFIHARQELSCKKEGVKWGKLDFCQLQENADLRLDGISLYPFVILTKQEQPIQSSLF